MALNISQPSRYFACIYACSYELGWSPALWRQAELISLVSNHAGPIAPENAGQGRTYSVAIRIGNHLHAFGIISSEYDRKWGSPPAIYPVLVPWLSSYCSYSLGVLCWVPPNAVGDSESALGTWQLKRVIHYQHKTLGGSLPHDSLNILESRRLVHLPTYRDLHEGLL